MTTNAENDGQKKFAASFEKIGVEMYALLKACPSRLLTASSTVNPRHPLPKDHAKLIAFETEGLSYLSYPSYGPGKKLKSFFISMLFAGRETLYIIYIRLAYCLRLRSLYKEDVKMILKTWYFDAVKEVENNFYFGNLAALLEKESVSTLMAGGNLGKHSILHFSKGMLRKNRRAVPEKALLPFWAPAKILTDQVRTHRKLQKLAAEKKNSLFAIVAQEAAFECLSLNTLANALHYYIAKRAVEIWKPKAYATLYEGQPWEKLAWLGAKSTSHKCLTVGYEHTIIMPYSWGLLKPAPGKKGTTAPDIVLTLGNIPQALMLDGHAAFETAFITLGSFRRTASTEMDSIKQPNPSYKTVLVVPEGFVSEAALLFERAAQLALLLPDHHFIFRSHPFLPFVNVQPLLSLDITSISNIELSPNASIDVDFARASSLLYRGSSVVLYGILNGLKPWYLNEPGLPYVDPLFALTEWRESASSVAEVALGMNKYAVTPASNAYTAWMPAKTYIEAYSTPIKEKAIKQIAGSILA